MRLTILATAALLVTVTTIATGDHASLIQHDAEVARKEPGTHNGGGETTGYSFFAKVSDPALIFRKRALHPGSGIGLHRQDVDEVYYVLSGNGELTLDGEKHEIGPGTAILTRTGSSHSLKQVGAEDLVIIIAYPPEKKKPALAGQPRESAAERNRRMQWWREARFGLFIHWGLYAVPAGEYEGRRSSNIGEWIMSWANIPRAKYEPFARQFNPVKFDAAEWVRMAKNAGMKYIVITSKHHDGFSMFDSRATEYDIVDATPFRRDPMRALADEAKRQGLKFCFYYSIMDWHHPSQYVDAAGKDPTAGDRQTKMREGRKPEYVAYMKSQLRELVTNYDPAVLWFDGEWVDWWTEEDGRDLYQYVRGLKPDIIINNRVGKGRQGMQGFSRGDREYSGDFGTPEQEIPPNGVPGVDWESCMTMNETWGYKSYDDKWKSTQTIVRNLIDIVSKGGNYLLNVGPMADGRIPPPSVERLDGVGKWMRVNAEAIHGTGASPFGAQLAFGRATTKSGRVYLHVFDWPANGTLQVPATSKPVKRAYLLADPTRALEVTPRAGGVTIKVPATPPDPIATVVTLEF